MFDLSHIPRVTDTLFVTQKEDKYLFLNTALPNWLVLNQNGAFIINLISLVLPCVVDYTDGNTTLNFPNYYLIYPHQYSNR